MCVCVCVLYVLCTANGQAIVNISKHVPTTFSEISRMKIKSEENDKSKDPKKNAIVVLASTAKKNRENNSGRSYEKHQHANSDKVDDKRDDVDVRFGTCYDFSFHCKLFAPQHITTDSPYLYVRLHINVMTYLECTASAVRNEIEPQTISN